MLNHDTQYSPTARWAIAIMLAVFIMVMSAATQHASAQDAVDTTATPVESAAVESTDVETAPVESAPPESVLAETDADDEVVFDATQESEAENTNDAYAGPDMKHMLGRFVLAIMVVLIILAVVLMVYQKLSRRGIKLTGSNRPLRIVDKLVIAPKQCVCLLNVCDRYLLLGVAEKEINVLTEVTLPGDSNQDVNFEQTLQTMGISKDDTTATKAMS